MNVNEVIANRAIELLGGVLGSKNPFIQRRREYVAVVKRHVSGCNACRSSQIDQEKLLPSLARLRSTLEAKSFEFSSIVRSDGLI